MDRMVAASGLICTECPAYIATQEDSQEKRAKVAEDWSKWGEKLKPEDINCDGCVQTGKRVFRFCNTCAVRSYVLEKNPKNCAYCSEYPCKKLDDLLKSMDALTAKNNLDVIRKSA
jgi:hypothetical protein